MPTQNLPVQGASAPARNTTDPDKPVRDTDLDASIARLSAVSKNYLHDEFAEFFVDTSGSRAQGNHYGRESLQRPPWVNIGTHQRTYMIDELVESFLLCSEEEAEEAAEGKGNANQQRQVLSLGAGSDSRFWRLKKRADRRQWPHQTRWVETDLQPTVTQKINTIISNDTIRELCGHRFSLNRSEISSTTATPLKENYPDRPPTEFDSDHYAIFSADLRRPTELIERMSGIDPIRAQDPLLDPCAPTLIIAELVFLYLSPHHTHACLDALAKFFKGPLMIVSYEALNLEDNFSKMMVQNLARRGLDLAGFESNRSIDSQISRFRDHGFTEIVSTDMKALRLGSFTPLGTDTHDHHHHQHHHHQQQLDQLDQQWKTRWQAELHRIKTLEFLDEVEELELILQHYSLSWARKKFIHNLNRTTLGFYLPQF